MDKPVKKSDETPEARFKRLAEARTKQVLKQLRVLGNCSNGSIYRYTPEQVEKIFTALEAKLAEVKAKFQPQEVADKESFAL